MSSDDQRPDDEREPKDAQQGEGSPDKPSRPEGREAGPEAADDSPPAKDPESDAPGPPPGDRELEPEATAPEEPAPSELTSDAIGKESVTEETAPREPSPPSTKAEPQAPADETRTPESEEPATPKEADEPSAAEPESPQQPESPPEESPATSAQEEKPDSTPATTESPAASYYDDPYDDYEYTPPTEKATTTAVAKPPPPPPPPPDDGEDWDDDEEGMVRMSFLEHLEELRTRIIHAVIGLVVAYAFALLFAKQLFGWVTGPVQRAFATLNELHNFDPPLRLVALTPPEQFQLLYLKIPLLAAVFLGSPWLVYQAWAFIAPGLYRRERRWAQPFIFSIAGLFILGGLFGYFVVLRFALVFLLGIGIDVDIQPMISISSYFNTFVMIELGLGVVFQLPVLIFFLTLLRIVNPSFLLGNVRYAILIIFILAAVITPTPDVFNMILFAAPMILLFYVGIGASYLLVLKRERGRIPWLRIISVALLILLAVVAAVLYFVHSQLGYQFIDQFPWIVPPQ